VIRPERESLLFWLIVGLCAFTRLWDLGARGIMHDESLFVYYTYEHLYKGLTYTYMPILHGPAMLWLQAGVFHVFGASDYTMRLGTALLGIAGLWWIRALRPWLGPVGVLTACAFYTLSPTLAFYQRFFRNDGLFIFTNLWIVASALYWWRWRNPKWLASFVVAVIVLFCNMESCVFLYFSLATFLALAVLHDLAAWILDDRRAPAASPAAKAPSAIATAIVIFAVVTLFLTRVLEGISYEQSVVDAIKRNFALRDVRSIPLALGIVAPNADAGTLGSPWFWRVFYALLAAVSLAAGVLLRLAVRHGWGETALLARLWSGLRAHWMWFVGALCFGFAMYMVLFTTAFHAPKGPFQIYHETLEYWMGQNAQHRIHGPFHMHMLNMAIYETGPLLAVLIAGIGVVVAMRWSRTRAVGLLLCALAYAAFHFGVFARLESPVRYMAYSSAELAMAGFFTIAICGSSRDKTGFSSALDWIAAKSPLTQRFLKNFREPHSAIRFMLSIAPVMVAMILNVTAMKVIRPAVEESHPELMLVVRLLSALNILLGLAGALLLCMAIMTLVRKHASNRSMALLVRVPGPVVFFGFLLSSLAYFNSSAWREFHMNPARRGGVEIAWSGKQFLDDTLSLTSGIHLFLIAFLILVGTTAAWRCLDRGQRFRALLVWWLVTMTGACSYAREKVPWVGIYMTLPLLLLLGACAQAAWDRWLAWPQAHARRTAFAIAMGVGLLWGAKGTFNLCFVNYDDVRERMVFAHPPREVKTHVSRVMAALEGASLRTETGAGNNPIWHEKYNSPLRTRNVRVLVQNETLHWPMRWYFREAEWDQSWSGASLADAGYDFMFLNADARTADPGLEDKYDLYDGRVHMHWVAPPLNRGALLDVWRMAMPEHLQDRDRAAKAGIEWRKVWRYLMYREIPIDDGRTGLSWVGYVFAVKKGAAAVERVEEPADEAPTEEAVGEESMTDAEQEAASGAQE